jgi:hypothetical protein
MEAMSGSGSPFGTAERVLKSRLVRPTPGSSIGSALNSAPYETEPQLPVESRMQRVVRLRHVVEPFGRFCPAKKVLFERAASAI